MSRSSRHFSNLRRLDWQLRDPDCRFIEPNPAMRRLLRLPLDANASLPAAHQRPANFRALREGVEVAPENLPMQVTRRTGIPVNGSECEIEFDDGSVIYLLGSSTPLFDELAKPRGLNWRISRHHRA